MQPTRALAAKNNLLICLDAFGTLFTPTRSVAATYAETAARHGVPTGGAENARLVGDRFKTAFKGEAKRNPVFGKATGLGAEKWWGNVIRNTFSPFLKSNQDVPAPLIAELYEKYSTGEPYQLYPDVKKFFLEVQKYRRSSLTAEFQWPYQNIVVGIITNSDDRVPSILESFDLQIAPRRFGVFTQDDKDSWIPKDIEFVVQSYDVGFEKPDHRVFDAATSMLANFLAEDKQELSADDFEKLYVGDELENDYDGATAAGWHAVLLDRNGVMDKAKNFRIGRVGLKDKEKNERKIIMTRSLLDLGIWRPSIGNQVR